MADPIIQHPPTPAIPLDDDRIWIDGCFDFAHHGHANAILQAKLLGKYLCVGVHSDEEIAANKGPTVMTMKERLLAVEACKWTNLVVPDAPYVTDPEWLDLYGCKYVVHGDDITTDGDGRDCYETVKEMGRFKVVKRTDGISTTDLVGRMLLCTKGHWRDDRDVKGVFSAQEIELLKGFASDERGVRDVGSQVWIAAKDGQLSKLVEGKGPEGRKVVYVDGGFDLFSSGQIEFLKLVVQMEQKEAAERGEFEEDGKTGMKPYVVAGVHGDRVINQFKGLNYPIMNIFERGMCVLQCRYVSSVVLLSPFKPTVDFLKSLPHPPSVVYHGPRVTLTELEEDPYADIREAGLYQEIEHHEWETVNASEIVERILRQRIIYEERQRKKLEKAVVEVDIRQSEMKDEKYIAQ
ncbi:phosphoethanolamine [Ascobolus immersus RN42]|uniref:ethanolamine-phosphate cytidylyltransferase n=1 Tax=Ascobolus immersus RN42 TaxID=1160509 RepID=A0A3N4IN97_ASCIM|nr:phosphoethanolamine [Ascobolus immersus RN42]